MLLRHKGNALRLRTYIRTEHNEGGQKKKDEMVSCNRVASITKVGPSDKVAFNPTNMQFADLSMF
jgi:hypothetical protein